MRSITIESFGETKDDRTVALIKLSNGVGMSVELLNLGACVRSITVPDRDGIPTDVVLGYDTVQDYERDNISLGSTLGRVAGRIRDARFALNSKMYYLAQNDYPHHKDGGAKSSLSKKVWDYCLLEEGNGVVFSIRSHDGEEGYPGNVTIQLSYILTNHNELLTQFSASSDKTTLLNLTNNVFFNLNGEGSYLDDHEVQINTSFYLPREECGLVQGDISHLESSSRDPVLITEKNRAELNKLYCFDPLTKKPSKHFRHLVRVASSQTGIDLNITSTQGCVLFDCGTDLNLHRGKDGKLYKRGSAFIASCRGFEDACNQPQFPTSSLRPDQLYQHITIYRFSVSE